MPYDEDKQWQGLSKLDGEWNCKNCGKTFKMGEHPDKPGKQTALNPDGSRHQKFKFPPKEVDGKKIWEWTCTSSNNDWSQKKEYQKSDFNSDFPLKSEEIIKLLTQNSKLESKIIEEYFKQGIDTTQFTLAKFAGCLAVCEKLGNTRSAFVGMIFKVGEKTE